jgi:hypothetical protein
MNLQQPRCTSGAKSWISAAQLAGGRVVESAEVLRDVEEAVARIKAKKAAAPQR